MQKKKVKLSKSAKGALLYMLVVLSIFAVLETVVCRLPSHFDESNTEAYTGTLSHVEKYTTWHIGYRAMHSKQHIRLHFTDGNVYFVYTLEDRTLLSIPAGERLSLRLYRDPRRGTSACDIRSDSRVFQTMERSSQLAHSCLLYTSPSPRD